MTTKDPQVREDIAHEAVCNTIASINEQLKLENQALDPDRLQMLRFDLEKRIRQELKKAVYTHDVNTIEV